MAIGAFVPLALFVVILGSVGVRLVMLWRRTRELPELSLGAGLLLVSLSMPFSAVGRLPATALEPIGRICFSAGMFAIAAGISLMVCFNYLVFRRGSAWGLALLALLCGMLLGAAAFMSLANGAAESVVASIRAMRPGTLAMLATILICFGWGGSESFRCRRAQTRQMALGLGDAVVANRFWLWCVASITSSLLLLVLIGCVMAEMTILREPAPLMTISAAGTVMSMSWYLTFFPPERYLRLIRQRAAAT